MKTVFVSTDRSRQKIYQKSVRDVFIGYALGSLLRSIFKILWIWPVTNMDSSTNYIYNCTLID